MNFYGTHATQNKMLPFHILLDIKHFKADNVVGQSIDSSTHTMLQKCLEVTCSFFFYVSLVSSSNTFYLHTEHRNMPLDDAMRLVGQNFDQYMQDLRERAKGSSTQDSSKVTTAAVPKDEKNNDITALLSKAASGASLSADQLTKLIDNLSKRQEEVLGSSSSANGKGGKNPRHDFLSAVKGILTTLSRQLSGAIFI